MTFVNSLVFGGLPSSTIDESLGKGKESCTIKTC